MSLQDKTEVYPIDVERFFQILKIDYKYNIIFLDPPYAEDNFQEILSLIIKAKIFNKNNLLIIHRENKTREFLNDNFRILETKKYGRSKIIFGLLIE